MQTTLGIVLFIASVFLFGSVLSAQDQVENDREPKTLHVVQLRLEGLTVPQSYNNATLRHLLDPTIWRMGCVSCH